MIEESARVLDVDEDVATVSIERRSACGSCSAHGGCGTALLAAWLPQRRLTFRLHNRVGARRGDTVVVGLDERHLQRYAMMLYATPLVGLLAGAVSGSWLAGMIGVDTELMSVIFGLSGLLVALRWIWHRTHWHGGRSQAGVRLVRVLTPTPPGLIPAAAKHVNGVTTDLRKGHR